MTGKSAPSRGRFAVATLLVFPIAGPAAVAFTMAGPLAVAGLFSLGPGGAFYAIFLALWWLPGLYELLAPPFLLTAASFLLASWIVRQTTLVLSLLAAELAFFVYFTAWHFVPGGLDALSHDYANLRAGFLRSPGAIFGVLIATAICWWIVRRVTAGREAEPLNVTRPWQRGYLALAAAAGIGGVALAVLPSRIPLPPAEAWRDCTDTTARGGDVRIRGCTDVIRRESNEPADRRATAYLRRGAVYADRGLNAGHRQDLARAVSDYTEAIRLDPNRAEAYMGRGLCHARLEEGDQTIADLDMAQKLDAGLFKKDAHRLFRARGLALARKGAFDRAIADHSEEIAQAPHYADGFLHRAAARLAKGDFEQAVFDFSEAIRIEPYRAAGYIGRGSIFSTRGDMDRALADFDEAIRRQPKFHLTATAYRKRGEILEWRGEQQEALAAFEMALSLAPSDPDALAGRERIRSGSKR